MCFFTMIFQRERQKSMCVYVIQFNSNCNGTRPIKLSDLPIINYYKNERIYFQIGLGVYRTLSSYNFGLYATCSHIKDGGRSHIQSRETIGQEDPRDLRKTTSARKFSSCVWSHFQDAYFL